MAYIEQRLNFNGNLDPHSPGSTEVSVSVNHKFDRFKGLSLVLLGAVLWGVSGTAAQALFQQAGVDPGWLVSVRMTVAGCLLLLGVAVRSGPMQMLAVWRDKKDAARMILLGIVGLLGVQYSYFASIQYGNAATATLLQYMGPIFITVYVALRQRRMPNRWQTAAIFFALIGAFLLVTNGDFHSFSISPRAVVWGLISAVTVAFYTLYPHQLLQKYSAAAISGWGMLIGGIGMSCITPPWHFSGQHTFRVWWLISFVVIFGTLIAFYVYISSLKYISASEASVLACGEPLSASFIAVLILHVHMGAAALIGGLCILTTVTILASKGAAGQT